MVSGLVKLLEPLKFTYELIPIYNLRCPQYGQCFMITNKGLCSLMIPEIHSVMKTMIWGFVLLGLHTPQNQEGSQPGQNEAFHSQPTVNLVATNIIIHSNSAAVFTIPKIAETRIIGVSHSLYDIPSPTQQFVVPVRPAPRIAGHPLAENFPPNTPRPKPGRGWEEKNSRLKIVTLFLGKTQRNARCIPRSNY